MHFRDCRAYLKFCFICTLNAQNYAHLSSCFLLFFELNVNLNLKFKSQFRKVSVNNGCNNMKYPKATQERTQSCTHVHGTQDKISLQSGEPTCFYAAIPTLIQMAPFHFQSRLQFYRGSRSIQKSKKLQSPACNFWRNQISHKPGAREGAFLQNNNILLIAFAFRSLLCTIFFDNAYFGSRGVPEIIFNVCSIKIKYIKYKPED